MARVRRILGGLLALVGGAIMAQTANAQPAAKPGFIESPLARAVARAQGELDPPAVPRGLDRPLVPEDPKPPADFRPPTPDEILTTPIDPPLGFAGPSGISPSVLPNRDFIPMEDRWRMGFPEWDRYGKDHPPVFDYPYVLGHWYDPYNQNWLKGDYPVYGNYTFFVLTAQYISLMEGRMLPTATTPFESTARPFTEDFFGRNGQFFHLGFFRLGLDLFHGDAAFKPVDWRVKLTPVFNVNFLDVQEVGVVSPDVRKGTQRGRSWIALEEYFAEVKLADLSPEYDFASVRLGSQFFNSDFRGFLFSDTNRAIRLFGTLNGNRDQFNVAYFRMAEKDTNSGLNTFEDRRQNVFIANYFRQDFLIPGYTAQVSLHYNNDLPSIKYDKNNFLVRPDPIGVFQKHKVDAVYFGWAGDGHIGRYNITHQLYYATGRDSLNPLANQAQDISAWMGALELSYDRDWIRFRTSMFYASGDGNVNNSHGTGFDTILDNPNFAGGQFSYWQRQGIPLFGVSLVNRNSIVPDLRASKIQSQANFVNPGLMLFNGGADIEITPKFRMINNANFLLFDKTRSLETFLFDGSISREIGVDLSSGFEYRPLLNNNLIFTFGVNALLPSEGFKNLYQKLRGDAPTFVSGFLEAVVMY